MDAQQVNYRSSKGGYQLNRMQKGKKQQQLQTVISPSAPTPRIAATTYTRKPNEQHKNQLKRQQQKSVAVLTSPIIDEVFGKKQIRRKRDQNNKKVADVTSGNFYDPNAFQSKRKKQRTITQQQLQQQQSHKYVRSTTNLSKNVPYGLSPSSSHSSAMLIKFFEMKLPNIKRIYDSYECNRKGGTKELGVCKDKSKSNTSATTMFPCWKQNIDAMPKSKNTMNNTITRKSSIYDVIDHIRSSSKGDDYNHDMNSILKYIQLTDEEIRLRHQFISLLELEVKSTFQVPTLKNNNFKHVNNTKDSNHCVIFGSFASIPICTFQSDLDVALFNVIDVYDNYKKNTSSMESSTSTTSEKSTDYQGSVSTYNVQNEVIASSSSSKTTNLSKQQRKSMLVAKWRNLLDSTIDNSFDEGQQSSADDNLKLLSKKRKRNDSDESDCSDLYDEANDDFYTENELNDVDTEDPMKRYFEQQMNKVKHRNRAYSDSTILSTKSDEVDSINDCDDENNKSNHETRTNIDNSSNMTVSFFASKPPATIGGMSMGPQGKIRLEVVNVLQKLCNKLRKNTLRRSMHIENTTFIKTAKVPIIKLQLQSGFNVDIAIGGFGTDTSLYAAQQIQLYPTTFVHVVVIVKSLLSQHNLDEPFTGGLGSYKLYILVADHIYHHRRWCTDHINQVSFRRSSNSTNENQECVPFEVLLMFFYRYGYGTYGADGLLQYQPNQHRQSNPPLFPYPTTPLYQHKPFISSSSLSSLNSSNISRSTGSSTTVCADLSNVYKLNDCIVLFRLCFDRLHQQMIQPKRTSDNSTYTSILAHIICPFQLQSSRERILQQTKNYSSMVAVPTQTKSATRNCDKVNGIISNTTSNTSTIGQLPLERDRTMDEILDGYKTVLC